MKLRTIATLAAVSCAGPALAGTVGAGPGGTGSLLVGSVVSTQSMSKAVDKSPLPGTVGTVVLDTTQSASLAAYLQKQPGTTVNGNLITAPTTFADGTAGNINLNTDSGELILTRI